MSLSSLEFFDALKVFTGLVFSVLFLQSGFDKLIDYKGNRAWISAYFKETPFKKSSGILFWLLMLTELLAGLSNATGILMFLFFQHDWLQQLGIVLSSLALLFVFTGQRIAKDYVSAANTIAYLAFAMLAWLIISK